MEIVNNTLFAVEALPNSDHQGNPILTIIVKGTFTFRPEGTVEPAGEQMPVAFGDEFHDSKKGGSIKFEADTAPFKPRTDVALVGRAYAPGGRPMQVVEAGLMVGPVSRIIRVFGDRKWKFGSKIFPVSMTKPEPFTSMELVYERAFGGLDTLSGAVCAENPIGTGFFTKKSTKTLDCAPLPNLEDPKHLIKNWDDHPKPAGFGFIGKIWAPRAGHLGTNYPQDFRPEFYNAAHPDLQVKGYLKGDEKVLLVNLTPNGEFKFRLPGVQPKASVTKTNRFETPFDQEVSEAAEGIGLNLDTLCLIPDEERFYMVWRGGCPIKELTALDVKTVEIGM